MATPLIKKHFSQCSDTDSLRAILLKVEVLVFPWIRVLPWGIAKKHVAEGKGEFNKKERNESGQKKRKLFEVKKKLFLCLFQGSIKIQLRTFLRLFMSKRDLI